MNIEPHMQSTGSASVRHGGHYPLANKGRASDGTQVSTTALAIWVMVQLAVLGLSSMRVMLWASEPHDSEQFALCLMLATQVGLSAILFPSLLKNPVSLGAAIVSAVAMSELAAFLASAGNGSLVTGPLYVSLWLITLSLVARSLRADRSRLVATAAATLWALGGPILIYLCDEFGNGDRLSRSARASLGSISGLLSLSIPDSGSRSAWIEIGVLLLLAVPFYLFSEKLTR